MAGWISAACCYRLHCRSSGYNSQNSSRTTSNEVRLDTDHCGIEVVIVKNGRRICGTGGALATAPLVQNKAYFEAKIQATGLWGVGVATRDTALDKVPMGRDGHSWILRDDGRIIHNDNAVATLSDVPQEGDVIGVTYDHYELNYYINGKPMNAPITGIKGTIYPLVYVDDDATIDLQFSTFYHAPPIGFDRIIVEKTLL